MNFGTVTNEPLEHAIALLLGVCDGASSTDGAGFNKFDSQFARDVYPKRPWSPRQAAALYKMIQKYRKQLAGMGFDVLSIPEPAIPAPVYNADVIAAPPKPQGVVIDVIDGGMVRVRFPYVAETVEAIRMIPGRIWDGVNKQWLIKQEPLAMNALVRFAETVKAEIPTVLQTSILAGIEAQQKAESEAKAAMADSMAVDADFNVADLGGVLMPFQRAGVKYAVDKRRVLIADEMGLGKTVQALATVKHLNAFPCLVICPASLKVNWQREARKWIKGSMPTIFEQNRFGDVCITNYDSLSKMHDGAAAIFEKSKDDRISKQEIGQLFRAWAEAIVKRFKFKSIILDEAHYLKNHKAQRSVLARYIAQAIAKANGDDAVVLALTGTPILNRPAELMHLLQIIGRLEDVGGFRTFRERYLYGNLEELQQICRSRFLIRREKSQVLTDLPAKRRIIIDIDMAHPMEYARIENAPLIDNPAAALIRIGELRRAAAHEKIAGVVEWVGEFLETGKKLILFSVHKDVQAALMKAFPGSAHIFGEDDSAARSSAVDRFQEDPTCKLIVCSLKAAGVGLTLTAASDVAFHEFGWTPGDMDQAEDRAHRIGQKDSVTCWYLKAVGADIDKMMLDLIEEKREVGNKLLNADRTADADQGEVKDRLVKSILEAARKRGTLKAAA